MPYRIRKAKCKQTDGDRGSYVLSYTDNKGKRHRNCHTSRKKARAQISAIEMPEGVDDLEEGWVPLAVRITEMLELELAELAGSFKSLQEGSGDPGFKPGDRIRPARVNREMMIHTQGKVPRGTIENDNGDGTYDIRWDPLPSPGYFDDEDDDLSSEDYVERRVKGSTLKRAKPD